MARPDPAERRRLRELSALRGDAPAHLAWTPSFNPWIIAISVMLATFMEVLDTSVANVALPHIAGSMSATTDEATWVLTSYLVANAIVLPCTGWLTSRFGRKHFLIFCIAIFTLASILCGAATSLPMLIGARIIQGAGGGALQPIAQAVLLESFPPDQRGPAMAAYGVGVVVAPIIGPTLGGWITDNYSWRWIFYINVPVGILAVLMARAFVEDPPYLRNLKVQRIDVIGFSAMALGVGALQIMLDKGQQEDWFSSDLIRGLLMIAVVCLVFFIVWELLVDSPIVDLRILRDRNFAMGTLMIAIIGGVLYGTTALLPLFLQTLMGYPALQSGLAVSPRGIGSLVAMIVVGRLVTRVDSRLLLLFGFALLSYATYEFSKLSLEIAITSIQVPNIITGFALGFIFVPLTTTTMGTLPNEQVRNATGIYNLMRNIGGSVGIAALTSYIASGAQRSQAALVANLPTWSPVYQQKLHEIAAMLTPHVGLAQAEALAHAIIYRLVGEQAAVLAYMNDFRMLTVLCILCVPGIFLFKYVRAQKGAIAAD